MLKPPILSVGVISDTHLPYRMAKLPPIIFNIFSEVDIILHAGDVDEINLLAPLGEVAPLYAVRGNIHLLDLSWGGKDLPLSVELNLADYQVVVTHGHRPGLIGWLTKIPEVLSSKIPQLTNRGYTLNHQIAMRLGNLYPKADIIIFGHTHVAYSRRIGQTLFFNPGSVVAEKNKMSSVGLLYLWPHKIVPQIIPLDRFSARREKLMHWLSPSPNAEKNGVMLNNTITNFDT